MARGSNKTWHDLVIRRKARWRSMLQAAIHDENSVGEAGTRVSKYIQ